MTLLLHFTTYDDFGRKTRENHIDGTYTVWSYYDCASFGGCILGSHALALAHWVYNTDGSVLSDGTLYFDQVDRPLMVNNSYLTGGHNRNEVRYDSLGRVASVAMPCIWTSDAAACPYWTTNSYDVVNRLTESARPISASNSTLQSTTYGYAGRTSTVKDALGRTTTKIALVTGSIAQSKDALGYYQNFSYDAFGSLLSVKDSGSNTLFSGAVYAYGIGAFQTSATDMDLGARSYTYDALGEVTAYSDAKTQHFSQSYDALARPLVRTEPDLTTTWTWGATAASYNIGKLQAVTAAGSPGSYVDAYTYDSYTRLSTDTKTLPGDAAYTYTYKYNATTGLLNTLQYPVSNPGTANAYQLALQYGYSNGILSSITDTQSGVAYWTVNAANPRNQVMQETLGDGVVTNRAFDAVTGWLGAIEAGVSGGAGIQNGAFLYDDLGDVTQRQDNNRGLTENFYYDADDRFSYSTLGGTTNLSIGYDATGMGNIASRSDVAGGAAWTYDSVRKHAVTQAGSSAYAYAYDANGNMTSRSGYIIDWTSYNYPSSVSSAGESATFEYGPDRQRWKTIYTGSIGTETTYHVGKLLEKVANGGILDYRHYIYAGSELVGIFSRQNTGTNTMRYVLEDHQSGFADLVSNAGTLDVPESFTAFGNRRGGETWSGAPSSTDESTINSVSRLGYTGQTVLGVSMGLNHLNGRVEDSITGRFLSPDPYVPDPGNTQSYNRYSYVNNNPLSLVDPTGFDATTTSCNTNTAGCGGGGGDPPTGSYISGADPGFLSTICFTSACAASFANNPETNAPSNPSTDANAASTVNSSSADNFGVQTGATVSNNPAQSQSCSGCGTVYDPNNITAGITVTAQNPNLSPVTTTAGYIGFPSVLFGSVTGGRSTTTLFRAVSPAELTSIRQLGQFTNPAGIESKYFSTTLSGAQSYAAQAEAAFGDAPYSFVQTSIPTSGITPEMVVSVDGGIPTVVVPTETLPTLTEPIIIIEP